jgi:predicted nucleic acid-binding protein
MIVVSDTGPLRYLILIEEISLLRSLYGQIAIPPAGRSELSQPNTPIPVRLWIQSLPSWIDVRSPGLPLTKFPSKLGLGESEAIALALELDADAMLTDDHAARIETLRRQVPVLGTLGILDLAAEQGLVDFPLAVEKLLATNFRASFKLIQFFLDRDAARGTKN